MKLLTAIFRINRLDEVREALIGHEISRITVSRCTGHGRATDAELYRGQQVAPDLIEKVRIDIALNDDFVETTIEAIMNAARSKDGGEVGDGKIFVTPLDECIRIRTGERGSEAI